MKVGSLIVLLACIVFVGCETKTKTPPQSGTKAAAQPAESEVSQPGAKQPE
jgi:hypothetical protein